MRYEEVIRAWKNPAFRATLTGTDAVMAHPSGLVHLNASELDAVSGAGGSSSGCSGGGGGKKSGKSHKSRKSHKSNKSGKGAGGCNPCR